MRHCDERTPRTIRHIARYVAAQQAAKRTASMGAEHEKVKRRGELVERGPDGARGIRPPHLHRRVQPADEPQRGERLKAMLVVEMVVRSARSRSRVVAVLVDMDELERAQGERLKRQLAGPAHSSKRLRGPVDRDADVEQLRRGVEQSA